MVQKGLLNALGEVLRSGNVRMIEVALEGLDNVLACGAKHFIDPDTNDN
jgi:hypothetical protein